MYCTIAVLYVNWACGKLSTGITLCLVFFFISVVEPHFRAFTSLVLRSDWALSTGGPFKEIKGGDGRQRTEPVVNGPLTTGRSVILQNTQMASPPLPWLYSTGSPRRRSTDGPGGIQGLPRFGTVKHWHFLIGSHLEPSFGSQPYTSPFHILVICHDLGVMSRF